MLGIGPWCVASACWMIPQPSQKNLVEVSPRYSRVYRARNGDELGNKSGNLQYIVVVIAFSLLPVLLANEMFAPNKGVKAVTAETSEDGGRQMNPTFIVIASHGSDVTCWNSRNNILHNILETDGSFARFVFGFLRSRPFPSLGFLGSSTPKPRAHSRTHDQSSGFTPEPQPTQNPPPAVRLGGSVQLTTGANFAGHKVPGSPLI